MSELWYQNPKILLNNLDQFLPLNSLERVQKINSLARLAIYFFIFIIILNIDFKWITLSLVILIISFSLGYMEKFTSSDLKVSTNNCQKPTKNNPFMNYTLGDLYYNSNRLPACNYDNVKKEIRQAFRSHLYSDSSDIWGKNISDRNFYTMPNTDIVNDQTGFAIWCFGNSGECKTTGNNCLKIRDPTYHRGRITIT